jgi:CheY-like chemotaxis protein
VAHEAKILLVDDRAENLFALDAILSSLQQELVSVRSGEAALDAVAAAEFAVILLDVVMPGMDGFETAAQIKDRAGAADVPIIFLTAAGVDPDLAFRGYAAGAVDYITKPFDPWVLRAKVSVYVDRYLKNQRLQEVSVLASAVTGAADALAALPAALASAEMRDGIGRLLETVAALRSVLERPSGVSPAPTATA